MKHDRIAPAPPPLGPGVVRLALVGMPVVWIGHAAILGVARGAGVGDALLVGAVNARPSMLVALAAYAIVERWLVGRRIVVQAAGHAVRAIADARAPLTRRWAAGSWLELGVTRP